MCPTPTGRRRYWPGRPFVERCLTATPMLGFDPVDPGDPVHRRSTSSAQITVTSGELRAVRERRAARGQMVLVMSEKAITACTSTSCGSPRPTRSLAPQVLRAR
jgi:hypothetical protein